MRITRKQGFSRRTVRDLRRAGIINKRGYLTKPGEKVLAAMSRAEQEVAAEEENEEE
jgi:hypothetical protein